MKYQDKRRLVKGLLAIRLSIETQFTSLAITKAFKAVGIVIEQNKLVADIDMIFRNFKQ